MKKIFFILLVICVLCGTGVLLNFRSSKVEPPLGNLPSLSIGHVLKIADESREVQAFRSLGDNISSCLVRKALRPCDSDWVTCIDDAWVVEYSLKDDCGFVHDGRLSLRLLIDHQGKIISRFPEKEYFLLKNYCMENYDCLPVNGECFNFIYGQLDKSGQNMQECFCRNQECSLR